MFFPYPRYHFLHEHRDFFYFKYTYHNFIVIQAMEASKQIKTKLIIFLIMTVLSYI